MPEDAKAKLELRLVPADGAPADPTVLDDIIRLIKQGIVTAPKDIPQVNAAGEFHRATDNSQNDLEAKVRHDIDQASNASQTTVEKRAEVAKQPDGDVKLADEALEAAQQVVSAAQRALIRGVGVQAPDSEYPPST